MSPQRLNEYHVLLRKLRADPRLWDGERIGNLIDKVKAHCASDWQARVDAHKAKADSRFMFLWS